MAFVKLNSHVLALWESLLIAQISKYCSFSAIFVSSKMIILVKWTGSVGGSTAALWCATKDLAHPSASLLKWNSPLFPFVVIWLFLSFYMSVLSPSFCICVCVLYMYMYLCTCVYVYMKKATMTRSCYIHTHCFDLL